MAWQLSRPARQWEFGDKKFLERFCWTLLLNASKGRTCRRWGEWVYHQYYCFWFLLFFSPNFFVILSTTATIIINWPLLFSKINIDSLRISLFPSLLKLIWRISHKAIYANFHQHCLFTVERCTTVQGDIGTRRCRSWSVCARRHEQFCARRKNQTFCFFFFFILLASDRVIFLEPWEHFDWNSSSTCWFSNTFHLFFCLLSPVDRQRKNDDHEFFAFVISNNNNNKYINKKWKWKIFSAGTRCSYESIKIFHIVLNAVA